VAEPAVQPANDLLVSRAELNAYAQRYLPRHTRRIPGNRCQLLRDGAEAFPAMLDAIRSAQHHVRLETYMLFDDAVGRVFARALIEAARRGVEVRVLYDALGSFGLSRRFVSELRENGVAIRKFRPFGYGPLRRLVHRDHRKILVVDSEVAFIGGINIAAYWAPIGVGHGWRDDVLQIEGPAVRHLERRFGATWRHQHFRQLKAAWRQRRVAGVPAKRGDISLAVLSSRRGIHRAYLKALTSARERVMIAAAYFVPDRKVLHAILAAARRGVEVRLVLNRQSDHPMLQLASRHYFERLLEAGVKIYEWRKGVIHAKTAVVDGVWATVGSFNLERMSLHFNHEANVAFADPRLASAIEQSFEQDCDACVPIELDTWRQRPRWMKWLERAAFAFRKLL
jgi:cardiolipin synthase